MTILHHGPASAAVRNLAGLFRALGVEPRCVDVAAPNELTAALGDEAPEGEALVFDIASLSKLSKIEADFFSLGDGPALNRKVLLLATEFSPASNRLLALMTRGAVEGVQRLDAAAGVSFPEGGSGRTSALAGHSYPRKSAPALGLSLGATDGAEVLMSVDEVSSFVYCTMPGTGMYVWSTTQVFDMERPLLAELEFEEAADAYVPGILFLREAYGRRCWHSPEIGAGLVIDDPLLVPKYGLLDFRRLLASARDHRYHVTLAFIPWNHRRTSPERARWFLEHSDCFSVCAHGCDHNRNEFSSDDYDDLLHRNFTARERMEVHEKVTGMPCEPVMVCPQEQYSLKGIQAFADSRQFLGLINTGCIPRKMTEPSITGADLLRPAQDAFFGFPVFKRHYWKDISAFAMAVFLGKPAILVEHHEFFAGGPGGAEEFVQGLRKIAPQATWGPLSEMTNRTRWERELGPDKREIRFFTTQVEFDHQDAAPVEYKFRKRLPSGVPLERVTINGKEVETTRDDQDVVFHWKAESQTTVAVKINITPVRPSQSHRRSLKYRSAVASRRALSEFRDAVIARNRPLLRSASKLMKKLKQAGG
jgi:hypothetical protein